MASSSSMAAENTFLQKEEIILLQELQKYRETFGEKMECKRFYEMSQLNAKYTEPQITNKMRKLKDKFLRSKGPRSGDDRDSRIYQLSESLWGEARAPSPAEFPRLAQLFVEDAAAPPSLRKINPLILMKYEDAVNLEKECQQLYAKEMELLLQKLTLKLKIGKQVELLLEIAAQSSEKDEQA